MLCCTHTPLGHPVGVRYKNACRLSILILPPTTLTTTSWVCTMTPAPGVFIELFALRANILWLLWCDGKCVIVTIPRSIFFYWNRVQPPDMRVPVPMVRILIPHGDYPDPHQRSPVHSHEIKTVSEYFFTRHVWINKKKIEKVLCEGKVVCISSLFLKGIVPQIFDFWNGKKCKCAPVQNGLWILKLKLHQILIIDLTEKPSIKSFIFCQLFL